MKNKLSRREFIRNSTVTGIGLMASGNIILNALAKAESATSTKSRVVINRNEKIFTQPGSIDFPILRQMVNQSVTRLTGRSNAKDAWHQLFTLRDIIGIKVNTLAGKQMITHPELANVIASNLQEAGFSANNIIIFDRQNDELLTAGYTLNFGRTGIRCYGTDISGLGYEPEPRVYKSIGSCFSRIVTDQCTALINVPVLKDHGIVGISGAMKNWYGIVHNPNKYHDNLGDPYIADLSCMPLIRDKMKLIINDALVALCHGGPAYKPQWAWNYHGIIAATDPVAHDFVSWQIIEQKRKEKGLPSLKEQEREPTWIATAADSVHKMGTNQSGQIEILQI